MAFSLQTTLMPNTLLITAVASFGLAAAWEMPMGQKDPSSCVTPAEYATCNKDALAQVQRCISSKKRDENELNECLCFN
ncbi:hypothetical protein IFR04_013610 [Cadophora malorum]|uniref:Extracellular membrane protein CFEM domain-containing protein n=1 Tax=Cadophora malorum TaxID=108018 RepID=A0A8H7T4F9_9HELO|nr:hypothetical protein IFR04_013610 [Cadophora malorum]